MYDTLRGQEIDISPGSKEYCQKRLGVLFGLIDHDRNENLGSGLMYQNSRPDPIFPINAPFSRSYSKGLSRRTVPICSSPLKTS